MLDSIDKEMLAALVAVAVAIGAIAAEMLHWARQRRIAALAFGPSRRPMPWAYAAPLLRVGALAMAAWALVTLIGLPPQAHRAGQVKPEEVRRLILVLDVSPIMKLADAGPQHKQRRD